MSNWTKEDLWKLDLKYAKEGIHPHQRPSRAAAELMGRRFGDFANNAEVRRIEDAYVELLPEAKEIWPGAGIGIAASVDQVRKLTLPVVFGTCAIEVWHAGFSSPQEWWTWCREQEEIALDASFAFVDLLDLSSGVDAVAGRKPEATTFWRMAQSNLEDIANALPSAFSVDTVLQPICLVAELALKGVLVFLGAAPTSFKGPGGHNLAGLATSVAGQVPHRDDPRVLEVVGKLPPYVASRYRPEGLTRLDVVRLALAVQFVAASTLRRVSGVDHAATMELTHRRPIPIA